MVEGFFNFTARYAEGWWERREFIHSWRRLHRADRRWVPAYAPALAAALTPGRVAHVTRQAPALVWMEALAGRPNYSGAWNAQSMSRAFMEEAVATAALLADPRREDGTAALALLAAANHVECMERLLTLLYEQGTPRGCHRLVGPVGLSPHLGYGVLLDHFDQSPPLHTPYNAPYLPELMDAVMEPTQTARLYHIDLNAQVHPIGGPAYLRPITAADDATLRGLLTALDGSADFPAPDEAEADFLLSWWRATPLSGWIAEMAQQPVGCVLLTADLAPALRRAQGGASWHSRAWWLWRRTRSSRAGRLLSAVVLPEYRRQGIGAQLWRAALTGAYVAGWRTLSIGPIEDGASAAAFVQRMGASPRQRYALYASD